MFGVNMVLLSPSSLIEMLDLHLSSGSNSAPLYLLKLLCPVLTIPKLMDKLNVPIVPLKKSFAISLSPLLALGMTFFPM
jgi:hypothetical protein